MPWYAWTLMLAGAGTLLVARIGTWIVLARRNRRPGFIDLRGPRQ